MNVSSSRMPSRRSEDWRLVERYVEDYRAGDFRCVFRRGDDVLEVSMPEDVWRAFGVPPAANSVSRASAPEAALSDKEKD